MAHFCQLMLLSSILAEFYQEYNAHAGLHGSISNLQLHSGSLHADPAYAVNYTTLVRRAAAPQHTTFFIVAACLIPVLVLLSGIFAGLTLGYMSLDETQLNVLASSGTA